MRIAVVTGASSGMGKEFIKLLDKENLDEIWGIALDLSGLKQTQKETKTKMRIFALDLTDKSNLISLEQDLQLVNPSIEWVINCSGFGKFGRYDEIPYAESLDMIALNCGALVGITEICLPFVINSGRIVQIASVAGFQPIPYINVYGATKSFVISYSQALNIELKPRNISVTCVCPFWTKTAFFNRAVNPSNKVVSKYVAMYETDKVIDKAFRDATKRKAFSIYGTKSKLQVFFVKLLPKKLVMKIWLKQQKLDKKYINKK